MARYPFRLFIVALVSVVGLSTSLAATAARTEGLPPTEPSAVSDEVRSHVLETLEGLPLSFERNEGQTDPRVRFFARGNAYTLYLTRRGAAFTLRGPRLEPGTEGPLPGPAGVALAMDLVGGSFDPEIDGRDRLPGGASYFKGQDPEKWLRGIPTFGRVRYEQAWPGIDVVFRGDRATPEYDFIVSPGADPGRIALSFRGAESLGLDDAGNLVLETALGRVLHRAPTIYQLGDSGRVPVPGGFRLDGGRVGFDLGPYDPSLPLVIDPPVDLAYSTFLGGGGSDGGNGIAVDASGNAYVTGFTVDATTDFPTTSGAFDGTHNGSFDAFVAKLSPDNSGTAPDAADLLYSTFLGGDGSDVGNGIAVDASGNAYVTGATVDGTTDFPTTSGAFDGTHNGSVDAFVATLAPNNSGTAPDAADLLYSTFLGGSVGDSGLGIAVDASGNAYVTGHTFDATTDFPTTSGAFDGTHNGGDFDAFVAKLSPNNSGTAPDASDLLYSTFLGGSGVDAGFGIAVDASGNAYVTGQTDDGTTDFPTTSGAFDATHNGGDDAFVAKLSPNNSGTAPDAADLLYSTFLGGDGSDAGVGIAVDASGNAYVTGQTSDGTTDFPTTSGAFDGTHNGSFDAFVATLAPNNSGTAPDASDLLYSTFLGGNGDDAGHGIAVDASGDAYVTGATDDATTDFPTTSGAFDGTHNGSFDAFVAKLSPNNSGTAPDAADLLYSTFLGGSGSDLGIGIAVDGSGNAYVTGQTPDSTTDFPTTSGAFDGTHNGGEDAFVAVLTEVSGGLTLDKADSPDPIRAGEPLNYTLTVMNEGTSDETAVVLTDTLPAGVVFFKATPSQGTCSEAAGVVTCSLGTIGAGNSATVTIIVYPTESGEIVNEAQVTSDSGPGPEASETTTVNGPSCTEVGTNGDDTMVGGPGVDVLCALSGNDVLRGEGSGDVLVGGRGHDTLDGGSGSDELRGGPSIEDTADYSGNPNGVTVDLGAGTATGASTDTLVDIEHARGSNFSDTLIGDGDHNNLFGLNGVDQINGLGGPDILSGNDGNDTIEGGSSNDILYGGLGNDTLRGQGGNDALYGHPGTDDCQGGTGSDTVSSCEVGQTSNG